MPTKRPDGRIRIRKTINGKPRDFYGKTRREAQEKADTAMVAAATSQAHGERFCDVASEWWESYRARIKSGTERAYRAGYDKLQSEFGQRRMKDITPADINAWLLRMQAQGLAQSTAKNALSLLSLVYKYWSAEYNGMYNPCAFASMPKGMPKTCREPPTPEQLEAVKANPQGFGLCAWLLMYTGARLGEVLALQWQDVDFDTGKITVSKSVAWVNNRPIVRQPKTAAGVRVIPLLRPLRAVLEPLQGEAANYILGGAEPLTFSVYKHSWAAYCHQIGHAHKTPNGWVGDITAHQFRHEFASVLYAAGVGELEAQRLLGHADIATTHSIYTHLRSSQLDTAAEKVEAYLDRL